MSSNTKTDLANLALSKFTGRRVKDIAEDSAEARVVRVVYDNVLRSVLASGSWDFAMRQAELAQQSQAPVARYKYAYTKPGDWIRSHALSDEQDMLPRLIDYRDVHGAILCDCETVFMEYVAYVDTPQEYPAWFVDLFAVHLAFEVSKSITASDQSRQALGEELKQRRAIAQSTEGQQHPPVRSRPGGWSSSRLGGAWR